MPLQAEMEPLLLNWSETQPMVEAEGSVSFQDAQANDAVGGGRLGTPSPQQAGAEAAIPLGTEQGYVHHVECLGIPVHHRPANRASFQKNDGNSALGNMETYPWRIARN